LSPGSCGCASEGGRGAIIEAKRLAGDAGTLATAGGWMPPAENRCTGDQCSDCTAQGGFLQLKDDAPWIGLPLLERRLGLGRRLLP
jgi:hypothetical protein